ncbi:MAG: hypothetical protein AAFY71_15345 [Bacteroidota bacterium]
MRYIVLASFLVSLVFLAGCADKKETTTTDAAAFVQFGSQQWEKSNFGCDPNKAPCATVKLDYPQAIFGDDDVKAAINGKIKNYVMQSIVMAGGKEGSNIEELALNILDNHGSEEEKNLKVFGNVMFRSHNMVKIEMSSFDDKGEKDDEINRTLFTFNLKDGKLVSETVLQNGTVTKANISMN